ncbi:MAG: DUF4115 domain-containing protein [Proteobacteria bacterium]|nr:DUF4115 domain-containing protein [Pseudomonadota bacterium]
MDGTNENQSTPSMEPGASLAKARESSGMTREQVATKLHLSARQIEALEANRYEDLPEAPYVRGYIRNYALLLKIDDQSLVAAFNLIQDEVKKTIEIKQSAQAQVNTRKPDGAMIKMAGVGAGVGAVVVLVVIALISIFNGDDKQSESAQTNTTDTRVEEPASDFASQLSGIDGVVTDADIADQAGTDIATDGESSVAPEAAATNAADKEAVTNNATTTGNASTGEQTVLPASTNIEAVTDSDADIAAPENKAVSQLVLYVEKDSWADVRDVSNKKLVYETIPGGRVVTLEGQPPFKVFIGNAKAVKLFYNGQEFDISPYYRGLVARFTLK